MASLSFSFPHLLPPFGNHRDPAKSQFSFKKSVVSASCLPESSPAPPEIKIEPPEIEIEPPEIEIEFIAPLPHDPTDKAKVKVPSGEKRLRDIMLENKLALYDSYGKAMNCGGEGSCGTCIVEILDGKELLCERTEEEVKYMKWKKLPKSLRLACQTTVGNKDGSGKVVVQRMPRWNKNKSR